MIRTYAADDELELPPVGEHAARRLADLFTRSKEASPTALPDRAALDGHDESDWAAGLSG
jgi:hypothetical protein